MRCEKRAIFLKSRVIALTVHSRNCALRMGASQSSCATHKPVISPCDLQVLFRILDKDNTGKLQGKEVETMFNAVLGFDTGSYEGDSAFDMEQVSDIVGDLHRRHPSWNVPSNVIKFINDNKDRADGADEGPMGDTNMEQLFKILDKDGSGMLDNMEAYRFFAHIGVPARYLYLKTTEPMDAEGFTRIIREINDERPEADLEEKVVTFIQESLANGKADFEEVDNPEEEPPAPEPTGSGRKRALLVGINYIGSDHSLGGCINDVTSQGNVLRDHFDFEDMRRAHVRRRVVCCATSETVRSGLGTTHSRARANPC